ncbi:glycosyltransferase family 4 protein [Bacillus taeanensis]|uniref:Glycosyltransferase family 1 protein n=1 Tax=Bacillus taeanensis TaxID=273032 RepID=A0A366Y1Y4_9BACI|nr:glycosyltransferase family 1 protein [Bacillus taeanensis]RBW71395.1 glycosyltransferase family 1 protein [Bacillus taeanensis]
MKLALFTDTYPPQVNGVAKTLKRLVHHLEKRNIPHIVFAPDSNQEELYADNIHRFISMSFFLYPECRIALPNLLKIKKQLHHFKPDLLHIATPFNLGLSGLTYGKKQQIPMVASYHTHFDHYLHYYHLEWFSNLLWRYMEWFHQPFSKIYVPSTETKEHLEKRNFANLALWRRGVDSELFHPLRSSSGFRDRYQLKRNYLFLFVGRLAPEKSLDVLQKIITQMPDELNREVDWLIVGEGPLRGALEQDMPSNVTFTGYLQGEELAQAYAASHLFVFPSTTETFGNVALEALSSGTPAVVANKGGVTEIVTHKKTGMIAEANNHDDFIQHILTLVNKPSLLKEMGLNTRQYALSQSWDTIFDNLLASYEEVIARKVLQTKYQKAL